MITLVVLRRRRSPELLRVHLLLVVRRRGCRVQQHRRTTKQRPMGRRTSIIITTDDFLRPDNGRGCGPSSGRGARGVDELEDPLLPAEQDGVKGAELLTPGQAVVVVVIVLL